MQTVSRRIVIATFGSLGDLHPYLAVARVLRERGHRPCLASTDLHRAAVESSGVEFAPVRPHAGTLGEPAEVVRRALHPLRGPRYLVGELIMPHLRDAYADMRALVRGADAVLTHPLAFSARLAAEQAGVPWASSVLSPIGLLSALDPPRLPGAPWLCWLHRLGPGPTRCGLRLVRTVAGSWDGPLRALRAELRLPPLAGPALFEGQFSAALNLALFSPTFAPPQPDWPPNTVACGFPQFEGTAPDAATRARLAAFMDRGEPPLVFTLGSTVALDAGDFHAHALEAARRIGRRALLITGKDPAPGGRDHAEFRYLPYSLVFERACAIVHQCGIGTLARALGSGAPQLMLPVAFDQPDNAARAARLGVGRVLPMRRARPGALVRELRAVLGAPEYRRCAARVRTVLRGEPDAAAHAADALERWWTTPGPREHVVPGAQR